MELTVVFDCLPAGEGNKVAIFSLWGTLSKLCNIVLIIRDRENGPLLIFLVKRAYRALEVLVTCRLGDCFALHDMQVCACLYFLYTEASGKV